MTNLQTTIVTWFGENIFVEMFSKVCRQKNSCRVRKTYFGRVILRFEEKHLIEACGSSRAFFLADSSQQTIKRGVFFKWNPSSNWVQLRMLSSEVQKLHGEFTKRVAMCRTKRPQWNSMYSCKNGKKIHKDTPPPDRSRQKSCFVSAKSAFNLCSRWDHKKFWKCAISATNRSRKLIEVTELLKNKLKHSESDCRLNNWSELWRVSRSLCSNRSFTTLLGFQGRAVTDEPQELPFVGVFKKFSRLVDVIRRMRWLSLMKSKLSLIMTRRHRPDGLSWRQVLYFLSNTAHNFLRSTQSIPLYCQ